MALIDHTGIGVSDMAASSRFYDAVFAALGIKRVMQLPPDTGADGVAYGFTYPEFWIDRFHPPAQRYHTAFAARSRAVVDAFHVAALANGGMCNGPPGLREGGYPPGYYAAFVLDPDGNNIEAVCRET